MRNTAAQKIADPKAIQILPCVSPPMKPSGTNAAATVANLSRIFEPPMP